MQWKNANSDEINFWNPFGEASFFCERENCLRCVCMHSGGTYQDWDCGEAKFAKIIIKMKTTRKKEGEKNFSH